jgi:ATP-dependent Clp protease ATP-binding subunit ClpA
VLEHFQALTPANTGQPTSGGVAYTLAAQAALERASWEADQRRQAHAGTGHLLLGVLAIEGSHARELLNRLGVSPEALRQAIEPLLASDADT